MAIEIFRGRDGWHFRLRYDNGRIAASSEAYASHANARRAARDLVKAIVEELTHDLLPIVEAEG